MKSKKEPDPKLQSGRRHFPFSISHWWDPQAREGAQTQEEDKTFLCHPALIVHWL
jgi:hypothetical protein